MPRTDLAARLRAHLETEPPVPPGGRLAVALSGGRDSVVLLHLLRFATPDLAPGLLAIHVDHAMRPGSAADARWVAGLCRAWGVPLASERLEPPPAGEAAARRARYRVLREAARVAGAATVATAHHADDQAETVLFRLARGAGPAGLVGIRERTSWLIRPLLPFTAAEIASYALARGLSWRADPSNTDRSFVRNTLRHDVLPALERVVPGTARSLARLAATAAGEEAVWERAVDDVERDAVVGSDGPDWLLARPILCSYDRALRARLLRRLAARAGVRVRGSAMRRALDFVERAPSGRHLDLGGGLRLERSFDRLRLGATRPPTPPGDAVTIAEGTAGTGSLRIGQRSVGVAWGDEPRRAAGPGGSAAPASVVDERVLLALERLRFPLRLRTALPGDRMRLAYGRKRVVRLLAEHGVPRAGRPSAAVLVDAHDETVWIPGVARSAPAEARAGEPVLNVRVWDERDD
ncbi:MAG TPA: tRNA lysidine(34) synthetase TilS [Longimicrobiales bacterium]|nr:tRNA lysidine(34) synthetase TilS [Longimicrobiales bacterium]